MRTGSLIPKSNLLTFLFFLLFNFSALSSFAQLMGKYEFTGVTTNSAQDTTAKVTTQVSHLTFSPFTRSKVQWVRGDNVYNNRNWPLSSTINPEYYIEFSITAQSGYILHLDSLSFDHMRTTDGPKQARIAHNSNGDFTTNKLDIIPKSGTLSKEKWILNGIKSTPGGKVTFRIYAWEAAYWLGAFRIDNLVIYGSVIPPVKLNEFHYANTAATRTGFIEVAVPRDFTHLNLVQIGLYNGAGEVYGTFSLANFKTASPGIIADEKLYYLDIPSGLAENQGGFCIYSGKHIIQFLSYGGAITAVSGPAAGQKSQDVGITERAADGPDNSLYLALKNNANYAPGTWGRSFDNSNTKGFPNEDNSVLPVELVYFKAQANTKEINLSWATAMEKNNEQFVLERSQEQITNFKPISIIKGNGDSDTEKHYKFIDKKPLPGTSYYRLKQVDFDGAITYSPILAVETKLSQSVLSLYPNPATELLNVDLGSSTTYKKIDVRIVNTMGKVVYQQSNTKPDSNFLTIALSNLPTGTYYLMLVKDGTQESKAFVKR